MTPLYLITALRQTDEYIEQIFMKGSCYKFYVFLKTLFPEAKPYMSAHKDHILTKIDGKYYDILGEVDIHDTEYYEPLTKKDEKLVEDWSFYVHNSLKIAKCDYCDELTTI